MYLRINLPKETKDPENYKTMIKTKQTNKQKIKDDIDEERYIVLLYQKTRYCENDSTMQSNLQILCNPYEINTQESLELLYANNEKTEREIKETIPFTIATKGKKYLGIYLSKETKDLHRENYKSRMKEIKEDTNR